MVWYGVVQYGMACTYIHAQIRLEKKNIHIDTDLNENMEILASIHTHVCIYIYMRLFLCLYVHLQM